MEKIFDKTSKKYLENLFINYFQKERGFEKPSKLANGEKPQYFLARNNGYEIFDTSITKNKWGFYECYTAFELRVNEHADIYCNILRKEQPAENNATFFSIIIGAPRDLKDLYNYDDGIITTGGEFEMYDYEDADKYFAAAIKIFEQFAEPFFKQIQTVEDVDMWYNKKIYEGDKEFIESARELKNNLYDPFAWWKGLIASRLAKNKDYDLLENTIKDFCLYWEEKISNPALLNVFYSVTNYFKTNNL